jgi:hypothetical protein
LIIHSIIPIEVIFEESVSQEIPKTKFINYKGALVEVIETDPDNYTVSRVISTSLASYLDSELQPGNVIKKSTA